MYAAFQLCDSGDVTNSAWVEHLEHKQYYIIPPFKFPYLSMSIGGKWKISADRCVPAVCIINEENNTQNAKRLNTLTSIFIT